MADITRGALTPEGYLPRACDKTLREMLGEFGAVEVAGTMWCGKTWTSLSVAESVTRVGNPGVRRTVRRRRDGRRPWAGPGRRGGEEDPLPF